MQSVEIEVSDIANKKQVLGENVLSDERFDAIRGKCFELRDLAKNLEYLLQEKMFALRGEGLPETNDKAPQNCNHGWLSEVELILSEAIHTSQNNSKTLSSL